MLLAFTDATPADLEAILALQNETAAAQTMRFGRAALDDAIAVARERPAEVIRLDAYDATAGAGGFYVRCGFEERGRVAYRQTPLIYYERRLV